MITNWLLIDASREPFRLMEHICSRIDGSALHPLVQDPKDASSMTWCSSQLAKLDKSPLFQLSLGSKELFHSNFLAWMFREFSEPASVAVGKRLEVRLARSRHSPVGRPSWTPTRIPRPYLLDQIPKCISSATPRRSGIAYARSCTNWLPKKASARTTSRSSAATSWRTRVSTRRGRSET